jgi:tRNA A-37 threonylcarbamoyl transferase component Bud32
MTFAQPFSDYEILDRVGAGAMGTVFKARHKRLNRIVALKVLKPSLARDTRYVDRLRREARIVASLNHPFIVTGYDLGEEGGYHFFVMEFVEGKSLRALLTEWGMFAEEYVRRVAAQVSQALDHAYQRGVIHRDIKPGNILIDEAGNVKLTDMGLAKGPTDLTLTRDGATVGTPQYISPEQARNPHDVDVRSDLYSLGATLYHMATGVPPFRGDTMAELITSVLSDTPVNPNEINPALSEGLALVIRKLLAKDLAVRYQTPRELLDDLDRIERSLPPQVDTARLRADAGEARSWWPKLLLAGSVAALLGGAWYLGMQSHTPTVAPATASEFLQQLDEDLKALPTPGARLSRLLTITAAPEGTAVAREQRQRQVVADLQRTVDQFVDGLAGAGWAELRTWLRDPAVWPDRARVERERIQPQLQQHAGLALGQLPTAVRLLRLEELLRNIDRALVDRDAELVTRFEQHLAVTVQRAVDDHLRGQRFAVAERTWNEAFDAWCNGVQAPARERLPDALERTLQEKHLRAQREAQPTIDAAESFVVEALRGEVGEVLDDFAQRLAGGASSAVVEAALQRFRRELGEVWPPAGRFRTGRDPWPDLERQFGELQNRIALATLEEAGQRFERRCDLAWRTACRGRATDALQLLADDTVAAHGQGGSLQSHRAALEALRLVEQAMLMAIARAGQPPIGFLRSAPNEALELRVERDGERLRLLGGALGQQPRSLRLHDLRWSDLLQRLQQDRDPFAGLPADQRSLGVTLARLLGDDLDGLGGLLGTLARDEERFLIDEVWPRILPVREERPDQPFDRVALFARLRDAFAAAQRGGSLVELENAMRSVTGQIDEGSRSPAEVVELRTITVWLRLGRRRRDAAAELGRAAPQQALVDVRIEADDLVGEVTLAGGALLPAAQEGWQLRDDLLEFADGGRPFRELALQQLSLRPGFAAPTQRMELQLDLVVPPASVGRRLWLLDCCGIAFVLVLGANDSVQVAFVDGDPRGEAAARRAGERALAGIMTEPKVRAVAGATHRLRVELKMTAGRRGSRCTVWFEGVELASETRPFDPERAPQFTLYPQQDVAVARVVMRAHGL